MSATLEEEESFARFAIESGRLYLGCGGPSSRLEERLSAAGQRLGIETEVFATPTGVFVSCFSREDHIHPTTSLGRVRESSINLSILERVERMIRDVGAAKTSPGQALRMMSLAPFLQPEFKMPLRALGAFLVGMAATFQRYPGATGPLLSGLITLAVFLIAGPLAQRYRLSGIFCDFVGCLVALIASYSSARMLQLPWEALSVGSLVLLAPGLTLTTAISELAAHDFVSGTAKMMKGALSVLAIGMAFLVFIEGAEWMQSARIPVWALQKDPQINLVGLISNIVLIFGFGLIFQVPRKALFGAVFTGTTSWVVLNSIREPGSLILASYLASASVGVLSLILGWIFRLPSQSYSVPGILSLLPGMLALASFRSFAVGQEDTGLQAAFRVFLVLAAITFGLFSARVPISYFRERFMKDK